MANKGEWGMSKNVMVRALAVLVPLALLAAGCSSKGSSEGAGSSGSGPAATTEAIDYTAIGLWDDGPCDPTKPALKIGLMTVFESPVVSLEDQAIALEASAKAFNNRGGANGSCIEVHTCDDGANLDQAVACVRKIDQAGVVATVNDQGTAGQAEVSAAMAAAGIPRIASNVTSSDWGDQNAYPIDPSGTGGTFMHPAALVESGAKEIGLIRVDLPAASALVGLISDIYADQGVTFPYDVAVPGGTTDYTQFILGAQSAGVDGVTLNLGEQEAVQVVRAGQQLSTDLTIGSGLGTFSHGAVAGFGDFAKQMVFDNPYPPATFDIPVYKALRADLAASGNEQLQPDAMRTSPMRSWIGLYGLLRMIRDAKMTDFTRDGISSMLQPATDVPMLDIFGGENWTPDHDHPGLFQRAGVNHYSIYRFDPEAPAPDGLKGNFVETATANFDETLCGSPFGAPGPC
jgi:ABC-type branched-subunit amino acid transport system substrate-binding protein